MNTIDAYIKAIGSKRPLTYDQEQEYARRIQSGDNGAFMALVEHNLPLVVKLAAIQRKDTGLSLIELISAGNIGLMKAARAFKPGMGSRFASYAKWQINVCMHAEIYAMSKPIRFPISMSNTRREKGICPFDGMAFLSKDSKEDAEGLLFYSMPDPHMPPDGAYTGKDDAMLVKSCFQRLSDDERTVLVKRLGLNNGKPMRLREIEGHKPKTWHEIMKRAISKLRDMAEAAS